jgi:hypothetical protein
MTFRGKYLEDHRNIHDMRKDGAAFARYVLIGKPGGQLPLGV